MSYPDLPDNRLIVDGVDLTERFKMVLVDGYTLNPPEPKTYTVDIPGGNGVIDLTDSLLGDCAYENRSQEFIFYIIDIDDFESLKTEVSNLLHGKAFDYKITMDPDYTYHGRFSVSEYSHNAYSQGIVGYLKITIDADPYKYKKNRVYKVDAIGGTTVYMEGGRKLVCPTIETEVGLKVIKDGKLTNLPQGTWTINDLNFKQGPNEIYFNSYDIKNLTWKQLKDNNVTWDEFKTKRLYEWYGSNGDGTYVIDTWSNLSNNTWNDLATKKWSDLMYFSEITKDIKEVYVEYKVGDL